MSDSPADPVVDDAPLDGPGWLPVTTPDSTTTSQRSTSELVREVFRREPPSDEARPVPDYVRQVAWFLDDAIPIGSRWRVGADGVLSFIPGVGDAAGFALSAVVVLAGAKAGVSLPTLVRMIVNATAESLAGMIPLIGPLIALCWKSNQRNLRLIEADLADRRATRRSSLQVLLVAVIMAVLFVLLIAVSITLLLIGAWKLLSGWVLG